MSIFGTAVVILLALALLLALDIRGKLDLGHPVWVFLTASFYFFSVVLMAVLAILALVDTLEEGGSVGAWLTVALAALPGTVFGVYVLVKSNLRPMGSKGGTPRRKAKRLLDCGLILGVPIQTLVVGGYVVTALFLQQSLHQAFDAPLFLAPLYPLVLMVLWPLAHLVFHTALIAWALDPILLLAALLIGIFWTAQLVYLLHGMARGLALLKKSAGRWALYLLLAFVPVAGLIMALRLRGQLKEPAQALREVNP